MSASVQAAVAAAVAAHRHQEGPLLPILHDVQHALGWVPPDAQVQVAQALNLSRAEVHGVVAYYPHFRERPAGRHVIQVCRAESCRSVGGEALLAGARERLGCSEAEPTSADGEWTVEPVYCLGLCAVSPAACVDGEMRGRVAGVEGLLAGAEPPSARPHPGPLPHSRSESLRLPDLEGESLRLSDVERESLRLARAEERDAAGWCLFLSADSAAVAVGADAVAAAIAGAAPQVALTRTSSRGLFWLEPLVECDTPEGRVGWGPVGVADVPSLLTAITAGEGATQPAYLGRIDDLPAMRCQQRVTFARAGLVDPLSLADYAAHGGWRGLAAARAMAPAEVCQAVLDSGLRGRGGAAFPAGIKWQTVAAAAGPRKYIACNADEGDSGTFADRMLIEGDPYALIEGMAIAAHACGADRGYVYLRSEYPDAIRVLRAAVERARAAGFVGPASPPGGRGFELEVRVGAGAYVCGEETAMLESLEGRRGIVRAKPPLPAIQGLFGRPTLIHNVLTLAAVPSILVDGAAAYKALGSGRSTGTLPFQLAGNVARPGLYELPFGATLRELVFELGGGTASGRPVKAVQVGGPLGAYLPESQWDVPLDYEAYAAIGAVVGHGGIVVHDDRADLAELARYAMDFCAVESCGKCTPCRVGSTRGVEVMDRILDARARREPARAAAQVVVLKDLCDTLLHGSLCAMGGMTPYPVRSALAHFPADFGLAAAPAPAARPVVSR